MAAVASLSSPSDLQARAWAGWRWPLTAMVLSWAATTLLLWDTVAGMVTIWYRSETFSHCFLVLPIAFWLVWRRRDELQWLPARPAPLFLLAVAAMALLWLLGDLVAVNALTQFAVVALWALAVPLFLGTRVAWALLFPLAFLFFSVPIGEFLMPQLMEGTADFTVAALRLSGIPVHREGLQFIIPSGNWSVVEACSGVRYLIASVTIGSLFAYLNYRSGRRRALFVLVAVVVPIVANWLRAYMIVLLGHISDNKLATGVDHLVYGWLFFGIVVLLMFAIGARWSDVDPAAPPAARPLAGVASAPAGTTAAVALAFLVLLALPDIARWQLDRGRLPGSPTLAAPASLSASWRQDDSAPIDFTPAFQHPSAALQTAYVGEDGPVGLYIGYYRNQDYEHKLVSSDNVLVISQDKVWARASDGRQALALADGRALNLRVGELRRVGAAAPGRPERLLAWQIYWVDGLWTDNDYLAKLYGVWQRLLGRGDESAVLVVYAAHAPGADAGRVLSAFVSANLPAIESLLAQARGRP